VNQLDAFQFDAEVESLLNRQLIRSFALFQRVNVEHFSAELTAITRFCVFYCGLWYFDSTFGKKVQNIVYKNPSTLQKVLWASLHIVLPWGISRLVRYCQDNSWSEENPNSTKHKVWLFVNLIERWETLITVSYYVWFLFHGSNVSLRDAIIGLSPKYAYTSLPRQVNFEYMNKNLVWRGFTEFFLFIYPFLNLAKIKRFISRNVTFPLKLFSLRKLGQQVAKFECAVCSASPPNTPYRTESCDHYFCYYCIQVNLMMDAKFCCPVCQVPVSRISRYVNE